LAWCERFQGLSRQLLPWYTSVKRRRERFNLSLHLVLLVEADAVGLHSGQGHVDDPQKNHEDSAGPFGAHVATELSLAEEAQDTSGHQQGDGDDGADGVDGHAEGQVARVDVELAVLEEANKT